MRTLRVELGARSYPIHVGRELEAEGLTRRLGGRDAVALVDANVADLQAERLATWLGTMPRLVVPAGEGSKCLAQVEGLAEALLGLGLGRDGVLVAVGGGVCGDLCGFVAASYLRGVDFVQVPTTLLAQVDASVGGKVAVNLAGAKNSLGYFLQPLAVFADLAFLDTLPRREFAAGLAELAKMAAILDPNLLGELERTGAALLDPRNPALPGFVERSCALKAEVVVADEREAGLREILNFGHTVAHALEGSRPKPDLLHGEAVAVGMLAALRLGESQGLTARADEKRLADLLAAWGLPLRIPSGLAAADLRGAMDSDKKRRAGRLRFVLLEAWGRANRGREVPEAAIAAALRALGAA